MNNNIIVDMYIIQMIVIESINNTNNKTVIGISMFGTLNTLTKSIKKTYLKNLFLNINSPILPENELDIKLDIELDKLIKEIEKYRIDTKIYIFNNQFKLYLDNVKIEFV
jgi:hypothetical protein